MPMKTTMVESLSSLYLAKPFSLGSQGQVAFLNSRTTSLQYLRIRFMKNGQLSAGNLEEAHIEVAGQEGLEPPTRGFGDRRSTN